MEHRLPKAIADREIWPESTGSILYRFVNESEREALGDEVKALRARSMLADVVLGMGDKTFEPKVAPDGCPYYSLVVKGSLLVGGTNPTDLERLNEILCGHTVNRVDDMSILSGRRGEDFKPASQCFRVTGELNRLVAFMKQREELPPLVTSQESGGADDEETLRQLLNKRDKIKRRNEFRQAVFSSWHETRSALAAGQKESDGEILRLPAPDETESESRELVPLRTPSLDPSDQLDVGGPAYQEITRWVETKVLCPLNDLVGRNAAPFTSDSIVSHENTAERCPDRPVKHFLGAYS
jgi:hypothetical protein